MKFIYFSDIALKEKILEDGIFLRPNQREINEASSGIFCYPMVKIPFKTPVEQDGYDDIERYLQFEKEEQRLNDSLTLEQAWARVDGSRVRKYNKKAKKLIGIIFELEAKHWPVTVFIDIYHFIANKFARLLADDVNTNISFLGYNNSLLATIGKIKSAKYVIANAPFSVASATDFIDLIGKFQQAGGGIWKEDSFECMLTTEISNNQIQEIIELDFLN